MQQTLRQTIIAALAESPMTAKEISTLVGIPEKEVFSHLEHVQKTLHKTNQHLKIQPAVCRKCGFEFVKRARFTKPGRCPQCHGTSIEEPVFVLG